MSEILNQAVAKLNKKFVAENLPGTVKFEIAAIGTIVLDNKGARIGEESTDVTLRANQDTFLTLLRGDLDPMKAYLSGKLQIDGNTKIAIQFANSAMR
ncbi:MAG: SCP2 sterol-binding domain-containing protein [Aestuariivita sp.]|nr:SCP2 sterol-binding domain-containing protein [Aestuariivita sp.]MCY4203261.1 SCP2 sterol-binding domain-containing protein [Aestuariivita sp.]MCY4287212.1 SCP2 sterol-binding domain-containing protein [Aestuariivita sp.]MCY4347480.1 SCP2 sterol-binding domain-containing protein [Aestuariivita sp.]